MPRSATNPRSRAPGATADRGQKHGTLILRVELGAYGRLGPGKIALLELIDAHGSMAAAGRAMRMSYRRAWLLVDALNQMFCKPLVATQHGGTGGGKAELTPFGREIVRRYRAIEEAAERTAAPHLRALTRSLAESPPESDAAPAAHS